MRVKDLHKKWMKRKEYRDWHAALAPEFELARAVIDARVTAGLTQEQPLMTGRRGPIKAADER